MGIKGLNTYLKGKKFFRDVSLSDYNAVVIDGNNICFQLYVRNAIDWERGGEYKEFSASVKALFTTLAKNRVIPIVVLEGLKDRTTKKGDNSYTVLDELQKYGKSDNDQIILPTLALPTFLITAQDQAQALKMDFEIHISAGESDLLIAAISNKRQCPVLAFDSDYYMFELQYGYIPFDDSFKPPECKLYHIDDFQVHFKLPVPNMRLLIPAIHGNDFISPREQSDQKYDDTIEELKSYKNYEQYLAKKRHLENHYENCKSAAKYYYTERSPDRILQDHVGKKPGFSVNISESSIDTHFCLIRLTTATRTHVMKYAVEKISRRSVWNCSQYIRQYMYGFLGIEEVEEKTRKKDDVTQDKEVVKSEHLDSCEAITNDLSPDAKKVLTVLKCNKMSENCLSKLKKLIPKLQLPVATAFYWYNTSRAAKNNKLLVKSLLFCFLDINVSHIPICKQFSWENVHAFSEWQSVYHDALALNYMVHSPFMATDPGVLFSGKKALYCARRDAIKEFQLCKEVEEQITKMFEIVTS